MLDYQKFFYKTEAKFRADLESGIIPNEAIVFVGDEDNPFIYTHGVEFKGGKEKEPEPVQPDTYDMSKIYYKKFTNRNEAIVNPTDMTGYSPAGSNQSSTTLWSVKLDRLWLHVFIPSGYSVVLVRTSNNEELSITEDFESAQIAGVGTLYKLVPSRPASYTLTFTFRIPKNQTA